MFVTNIDSQTIQLLTTDQLVTIPLYAYLSKMTPGRKDTTPLIQSRKSVNDKFSNIPYVHVRLANFALINVIMDSALVIVPKMPSPPKISSRTAISAWLLTGNKSAVSREGIITGAVEFVEYAINLRMICLDSDAGGRRNDVFL